MLMEYYSVEYKFEVITPVRLPKYPGFMLRGLIGEMLKKQSCIYRDSWRSAVCKGCGELKNCAYGLSYELGKDFSRPIGYLIPPPRPFTFSPLEGKTYSPGEELVLNLNIFYPKKWLVELFSLAVENLSSIGRDRNRGYGKLRFLSKRVEKKELGKFPYLKDRIRVEFITPTRIRREGIMLKSPSLYDILIDGGRRYYLIKAIYYGKIEINRLPILGEIRENFPPILRRLRIETIERWSEKRKKKEVFEGLVGSITYLNEGTTKELREELRKLIPFINVYGIGNRVSASMGKVRITTYYSKK